MKTIQDYYRDLRKGLNYPARSALLYARQYVWIDRQEARTDIEIEIFSTQDNLQVRGNAIFSGDDDFDEKIENEIIERLNSGDVWAWADVEVRVTVIETGETASDYLGSCSYEDESDFKRGGYYGDMIERCLEELSATEEEIEKESREAFDAACRDIVTIAT